MSHKSTPGSEPIYDARTLGLPKMLVLGLQHLFAMFGATVLVPILVQGYGLPLSIQTTLFFAGIGTLFFHICTRLKVPAFLGSSFAYLGGFSAVAALDSGAYATMEPSVKLQYACGGIVVAGQLYVILAAVIKLVGVKKVMRFLPPVVTGPIIILIGLNLAPNAVSNASSCWWLALLSIAVIVAANIWGKGMVKIIPILLGVVIPYLVAVAANALGATAVDASGSVIPLMDFSAVAAAAPIGLQPFFTDFTGSIARFDVTSILVMAPIAVAAMMEHIGDMSAISATVGENFLERPGLHRTLIGDGIATSLAGLFGGPANTTYGVPGIRPQGGAPGSSVRGGALLLPCLRRPGQLHPHRHHRRRVLHPVRHDLRHRRAQRGGKPGGLHQLPQPDHRRCHPGVRPGLLRRNYLPGGRRPCDPD